MPGHAMSWLHQALPVPCHAISFRVMPCHNHSMSCCVKILVLLPKENLDTKSSRDPLAGDCSALPAQFMRGPASQTLLSWKPRIVVPLYLDLGFLESPDDYPAYSRLLCFLWKNGLWTFLEAPDDYRARENGPWHMLLFDLVSFHVFICRAIDFTKFYVLFGQTELELLRLMASSLQAGRQAGGCAQIGGG